ncbi:MAG: hypothetical protein R3345_06260 [Fulvivirga sp.]|nr:hypothetical protein [Fulvivirga sp.]
MEKSDKARLKLLNKAKEGLKKYQRVGLEFATGTGKTYAALQMILDDDDLWDIVVPTTPLISGWWEEIEKFGLTDKIKDRVNIYCYDSLHKYPPVFHTVNYIFDEGHRISDNKAKLVEEYLSEESKIIVLSATINERKRKILRRLGVNKYLEFNIDMAVEADIVPDYELWVYKIPLTDEVYVHPRFKKALSEKSVVAIINKNIGKYKKEGKWDKLEFWNIWLKQVLSNLRSKERAMQYFISRVPKEKKTLIFAANIEQAERLCPNSYHSESKDDSVFQKFLNDEINQLSSVGKIREGINCKCDIVLMLKADKSKRNIVQQIGRSLRKTDNEEKKAIAVLMVAEGTKEEEWFDDYRDQFKNVIDGKINKNLRQSIFAFREASSLQKG